MQWFMTEPPVLEWLQIFYRIQMSSHGKVYIVLNLKLPRFNLH